MKKPKTLRTPAHVMAAAEAAADDWLREHAHDGVIRNRVRTMLESDLQKIVAKLLGFDNRGWSRDWELDHCNGRAGESAAGQFIRKEAGAAVDAWLRSAIANMPAPTSEIRRAMQKAYRDEFESALRRHVVAKARDDAEKQVERILAGARSAAYTEPAVAVEEESHD